MQRVPSNDDSEMRGRSAYCSRAKTAATWQLDAALPSVDDERRVYVKDGECISQINQARRIGDSQSVNQITCLTQIAILYCGKEKGVTTHLTTEATVDVCSLLEWHRHRPAPIDTPNFMSIPQYWIFLAEYVNSHYTNEASRNILNHIYSVT